MGGWVHGQKMFQQPTNLMARGKAGFLIPHRAYMNHMVQGHSFAFELDYQIQTVGKAAWHRRYRLPQFGFTYNFIDFGNRELLGFGHALTSYIQFHFIKKPKFEMNFRTGLGLGYITKKFERLDNPKNLAVASHINANIDLMLSFRENIGRFYLVQSIEVTHFSNASTRTPNLGLNIPTIALGLGHRIFTPKIAVDTQHYEVDKRFTYSLMGIFSLKQVYPVGSTVYPIGGIRFFVQKMIGEKSGFGLNADLMYNSSLKSYVRDYTITSWDVFQIGLMGHYTLKLDRLEFQFGVGAYLKNKVNENGWVYSRLGLQYIWDSGFLANLGLKTHYAKADYFELGFGYRFRKHEK